LINVFVSIGLVKTNFQEILNKTMTVLLNSVKP